MTVFNFTLQRGMPIFEQVVLAAIGAMLRGEYKAGQAFPSIRSIASDLKIHRNTAQKVIQFLVQERWLEARPGLGTVVASRAKPSGEDARRLIRSTSIESNYIRPIPSAEEMQKDLCQKNFLK